MEKNEIKKLLYKDNPVARFQGIRKGVAYYISQINDLRIVFEIAITDMTQGEWNIEMEGKHLIRWMV